MLANNGGATPLIPEVELARRKERPRNNNERSCFMRVRDAHKLRARGVPYF